MRHCNSTVRYIINLLLLTAVTPTLSTKNLCPLGMHRLNTLTNFKLLKWIPCPR